MADTTNDGRLPTEALYSAFATLAQDGWIPETVTISTRRDLALPVPCWRTPHKGRAVWILSGIHGEEPAGPNAIAEGIGFIRELGKKNPVVLLPLCNPAGYAQGWRYLNRPDWQAGVEIYSVGDCEHLLPGVAELNRQRAAIASSPEAGALAAFIVVLGRDYPPLLSVDFHEDNLLDEGYIYSQGRHGNSDKIAQQVVGVLAGAGIPIKLSGQTRFGQEITNGVCGPDNDGSVDELLAAERLIVDGSVVAGLHAETALVIETPAAAMPLEKRVAAHLAVIKKLKDFIP